MQVCVDVSVGVLLELRADECDCELVPVFEKVDDRFAEPVVEKDFVHVGEAVPEALLGLSETVWVGGDRVKLGGDWLRVSEELQEGGEAGRVGVRVRV